MSSCPGVRATSRGVETPETYRYVMGRLVEGYGVNSWILTPAPVYESTVSTEIFYLVTAPVAVYWVPGVRGP